MPLYFAYGSNMDLDAMRARCPRSRLVGRARLARHTIGLMADGFATVARHPRADVHGLLFDLALADVPALDRYEQVAKGWYAKVIQPVLPEEGAARRALVYVGRAPCSATAQKAPHYLDNLVTAARAAGLPADYIESLAQLGQGGQGVHGGHGQGGRTVAGRSQRAIKWPPTTDAG